MQWEKALRNTLMGSLPFSKYANSLRPLPSGACIAHYYSSRIHQSVEPFCSCIESCFAIAGLLTAPSLRVLELQPKSFMLSCDHMYLIGMMNLCELRLDSHSFKQQPLNRAGLSHIDNEGVKALVDSICARSLTQKGESLIAQSACPTDCYTSHTGAWHNSKENLLSRRCSQLMKAVSNES